MKHIISEHLELCIRMVFDIRICFQTSCFFQLSRLDTNVVVRHTVEHKAKSTSLLLSLYQAEPIYFTHSDLISSSDHSHKETMYCYSDGKKRSKQCCLITVGNMEKSDTR